MWTFKIPNWVPPSLNKGRGRNFRAGHKAINEVAEHFIAYNAGVNCPKVTDDYRPVRRVSVSVVKVGKLPDPDNLLKYLLDGLKRAGLIVDDSAKWCKWERPELEQVAAGTPGVGTVVVIADVPEEDAVQIEPGGGELLYDQLARHVRASNFVSIGEVLGDVCESMRRERKWGGIEFTRAVVVVRPYYPPHDTSLGTEPLADFRLYAKLNGSEQHFLSDAACNRYQLERLCVWAASLGIPVERDECKPEGAKRPAVACDDEFKW